MEHKGAQQGPGPHFLTVGSNTFILRAHPIEGRGLGTRRGSNPPPLAMHYPAFSAALAVRQAEKAIAFDKTAFGPGSVTG